MHNQKIHSVTEWYISAPPIDFLIPNAICAFLFLKVSISIKMEIIAATITAGIGENANPMYLLVSKRIDATSTPKIKLKTNAAPATKPFGNT